MTVNWVNRAEDNSNFNWKITVKGRKVFHCTGGLILSCHVKHWYASFYVHSTDEVERATVSESNISWHRSQRISANLGTVITKTNPYDQNYQCLRTWPQRKTPDVYTVFIHADKGPAGENTKRYNGTEASELASISVGEEDEEIGTADIVLRKRGAVNRKRNQVWTNHLSVTALTVR